MTWTALRWVWRLEAPLFIGMPPAGSLNRTRIYLPARAVHGAVTAELARLNGDEKSKFPDYGKFGKEVGENCRFTYLYPAEKSKDQFLGWLPKYIIADQIRLNHQTAGLRWFPCPQGSKKDLSDRDFRRRLLYFRPGTAIAPETDSASESTLRETECMSPWWRDSSDCRVEPKGVFFLGYVFLRNNGFRRQLESLDTLFVGGDIKYGLGKLYRVELREDTSVFAHAVNLSDKEPVIKTDVVLGHALASAGKDMRGMKELPGGWEIDNLWKRRRENAEAVKESPQWVPGSCSEQPEDWWAIDTHGIWKHVSTVSADGKNMGKT